MPHSAFGRSLLTTFTIAASAARPSPADHPSRSPHPPADSTLLVTGSADKNIKVWGLDFGDCHRSLFAHADSVMAVAFVPNTHYVFTAGALAAGLLLLLLLLAAAAAALCRRAAALRSCKAQAGRAAPTAEIPLPPPNHAAPAGKDRLVKYWDADKFEHLLTLEGHHAEVRRPACPPAGLPWPPPAGTACRGLCARCLPPAAQRRPPTPCWSALHALSLTPVLLPPPPPPTLPPGVVPGGGQPGRPGHQRVARPQPAPLGAHRRALLCGGGEGEAAGEPV